MKCRKVGVFPLLLLFGKCFLQITFLGVSSSKYLNGFEIIIKIQHFLYPSAKNKLKFLVNLRMQIRKKWLLVLQNFSDKHFKEYQNIIRQLFACESHQLLKSLYISLHTPRKQPGWRLFKKQILDCHIRVILSVEERVGGKVRGSLSSNRQPCIKGKTSK